MKKYSKGGGADMGTEMMTKEKKNLNLSWTD
jgi:hypothetical protein